METAVLAGLILLVGIVVLMLVGAHRRRHRAQLGSGNHRGARLRPGRAHDFATNLHRHQLLYPAGHPVLHPGRRADEQRRHRRAPDRCRQGTGRPDARLAGPDQHRGQRAVWFRQRRRRRGCRRRGEPSWVRARPRRATTSNFSAAVNVASAPSGMLIPPSNTFIVYSLVCSTSIAALFVAGYGPGHPLDRRLHDRDLLVRRASTRNCVRMTA